jgi:hypothetical protein
VAKILDAKLERRVNLDRLTRLVDLMKINRRMHIVQRRDERTRGDARLTP